MLRLDIATRLVSAYCLGLLAHTPFAHAIEVKLSLNVFPTSFAAPNSGGAWTLVAKTNHLHGISGINAFLRGINTTGISYGPNINAELINGNPFVLSGNPVSLAYLQDPYKPGVVLGVGTPGFSATLDPLGAAAWNNATLIAVGTYSGAVPEFGAKGNEVTEANLFGSNTYPYGLAVAATMHLSVRIALTGDYKRDGVVDAADYTVWRDNLGAAVSATSSPDGNGNAIVDEADYQVWRTNFGQTLAGSAAVGATSSNPIPEPAMIHLVLVVGMLALRRRR